LCNCLEPMIVTYFGWQYLKSSLLDMNVFAAGLSKRNMNV
jgi:hypothetical protein